MLIIEKAMDLEIGLMDNLMIKNEETDYLFIDIETTGFSSNTNPIFLIGCLYYNDGHIHLIQWLSEKEADEYELLYRFSKFLKSFKCLIHYNGTSFDIPYILKRMALYNIPTSLAQLTSFDLYVELKPFRKHLGYNSLKLKAIEKELGFSRNDLLDGRELIHNYHQMLITSSRELSDFLLCHNEDDLIGLYYCLKTLEPIKFFKACRSQSLPTNDLEITQHEDWLCLSMPYVSNLNLTIECTPNIVIIAPSQIRIKIPILNDLLFHYYSDYNNYFYLPLEDYVIHKSVGQYVDKAYRQNATKQNCYIKKRGTFIPLNKNVVTDYHVFQHSLKDSFNYVELSEQVIQDKIFLKYIFNNILSNL